MTPSRRRAGGSGETIRFALGECSLGSILVGATGKGVCSILLGDTPESLLQMFQEQFPNAELVGGENDFDAWVARVVAYIDAPGSELNLPLDIRGTAFQQRVWKALGKIPMGQTASYADIAKAIGAPASMRAVAQACGANKLAVVIPCHRVVRSDGGLSGYRWGVERKQALLDRESYRQRCS
jgi:AraC family transcriptional regulator of adaptative response/methylated-DNA-[protein]-cysteine methyltransferase